MVTKRDKAKVKAYAFKFPGAWEDHPWGESVAKVKKKVFVFFGVSDTFGMSVKLPHSAEHALMMPFCEPTGYGLGKSGWVSVKMTDTNDVPLSLMLDWVEESYRAVAGKRNIAELDASPVPRPKTTKKKTTKKKTAKKKTAKKKKKTRG